MTDTKEKNKYITDWKREHVARVLIEVKPEVKSRWQSEAKRRGVSLTRFISSIVNNFLDSRETGEEAGLDVRKKRK